MVVKPQTKANKTDAGNGSKAICRVSNVLRSPSPDPSRSANEMKTLIAAILFICSPAGVSAADPAEKDEKAIRSLIEDLVFVHEKASETPLISPGIAGNDDKEYKRQFEKCQEAFKKLSELKARALPILVEHLEDKRPSIHFRNHYEGHSVGDACYWNIYFQLQDRPSNYSEYGYQRKGSDGENHPKPYWEGTPFDEAGGIAEWLKQNEKLSYVEMQIKCLNWLLEREKKIGAPDADSYFLNILPLEIRILERRLEAGAEVEGELKRLRDALAKKDVTAVPANLLPSKAEQD